MAFTGWSKGTVRRGNDKRDPNRITYGGWQVGQTAAKRGGVDKEGNLKIRPDTYMGSSTKYVGGGGGGGGYADAYGGGGGWYASPLYNQLTSEYQAAYDEARKANESRYQEMLNLSKGLGEAFQGRLEAQTGGMATGAGQQAVTSGLSNVPGAVQSAKAIAVQPGMFQQANLQEQLRRERIGIIERRQDPYPSRSEYINLAQGMGRYANQYSAARPASRPGWLMPGGGRSQGVSRGGGVFMHA